MTPYDDLQLITDEESMFYNDSFHTNCDSSFGYHHALSAMSESEGSSMSDTNFSPSSIPCTPDSQGFFWDQDCVPRTTYPALVGYSFPQGPVQTMNSFQQSAALFSPSAIQAAEGYSSMEFHLSYEQPHALLGGYDYGSLSSLAYGIPPYVLDHSRPGLLSPSHCETNLANGFHAQLDQGQPLVPQTDPIHSTCGEHLITPLFNNLTLGQLNLTQPKCEAFDVHDAFSMHQLSHELSREVDRCSITDSDDSVTRSPSPSEIRARIKQRRRASQGSRPRSRQMKKRNVKKEEIYTPNDSSDESSCDIRHDTKLYKGSKDASLYTPLKWTAIPLKGQPAKVKYQCMEDRCTNQVAYHRLEHLLRHFHGEHLKIGNLRCPLDDCKAFQKGKSSKGIRPDNMDQHLPTHVMDAKDKRRRNDQQGLRLEEVEAIVEKFYGPVKAPSHVKRLRFNVLRRRLDNELKAAGYHAHRKPQKKGMNDLVALHQNDWAEASEADKLTIIAALAEELMPKMSRTVDNAR